MANQFKWDKPTMTAKELSAILHGQYGPECPTRILVEDDTKPLPYMNALVQCECMRCGKTFSMAPYALVNSIYLNGYVCSTCGNLSDDELKTRQQESMRVATIETLKEHGIDVVKEAIEEQEGKKKKNHPSDPLEDEFSSTADEDEMDMSEIYGEAMNDQKSMESTTPVVESEPTSESKTDEVVTEDNVSDEEEVVTEDEIPDEEDVADDDDPMSEYLVSDDDYSNSISDSTDDIEDEDITEDDIEEAIDDEIISQNESAEIKTEEETVEESEEITEDDVFGVEEGTEDEVETDSSEPEIEEEQKDETNYIWIGDKPYTQDELTHEYDKASKRILDKMHFIPFDLDTCSIDTESRKIGIKCLVCGETATFESFDDFGNVQTLSEIEDKYGQKLDPKKFNNYRNIEPLITGCVNCISSLFKNGFNAKHKATVLDFAKKSNFEILDTDKHLFINDANEEYKVKCNGVVKYMRYGEMLKKFIDANGNYIDARTLPLFKPVQKSIESTNVKTEEVKPISKVIKTEAAAKPQGFTVNKPIEKPEVNQQPKPQPQKIVLHPVSSDEIIEKAEQKKAAESEQTKSAFIFNKGAAGTFDTGRTSDDYDELEAERLKKERDLNKKNVFSVDQKFKIVKKDQALLSGKINPFERKETLTQEFEETVFFDFIQQLSERTGIEYKLVLNDHTYEIPVIDFESGLRIICSNLAEADLVNVRYEWINPRVPFSFFENCAENDGTGVLRKKRKSYKWCILFSDSVEYARDATFSALVKYINPKILPYEGKKIVLQDNLIFQYTKHNQYLRDFDKRNSTFPSRKPNTGSLGIIARWNSSNKATAKDVLKFKLQLEKSVSGNVANLDTLANDYNEYMVASIKYIEQLNKETNRVLYTITEYVEAGSCMISDGFTQCVRALLKEYQIKYPQFIGVDPFIVVEIDPNTFPSPTLQSYIDRGLLCKVDNAFRSIMTGQIQQNQGVSKDYRFVYVRRPEYRRNNDIDHMRQDRRMFTTGSLINRMSEEIKQAGLSNTIRNPEIKKAFIANMGYVEATQAETKLYFVNRSIITSYMTDGYTLSLQEHIDESNFNASNMVNDSNVGIGINNVMMNPNLLMKYNRIMQNGTSEAKDYFARMVQEDYQQKMMEMMMNQQSNGQANVKFGQQNFQMPNPMMGMGMMNPMMGGMNMNPMMGMNPMGMMPGFGY